MAPPHGRMRIRDPKAPYLPSYLVKGQKCAVCEDAATGLHYRAITCEGCKGFFRRAFQRQMRFECKGQRKCPIGKDTRNACQQCRLDKCLAEGMDPQLVLNEPQRVAKKSLIERNRTRKQLERVQFRVRKALAVKESGVDEEDQWSGGIRLRELINRSAREYCAQMDKPLGLDAEEQFGEASPEAQFALFWGQMLARVVAFGNSFAEFEALGPASVLPQAGWLPAVLFHALQPVNEDSPLLLLSSSLREESGLGDSLVMGSGPGEGDSPPPLPEGGILGPGDLALAPGLVDDLCRLSRCLLALQLSHAQIGLSIAFLLFRNVQSAEFRLLSSNLLKALRTATMENMANGESADERLAQWPVLLGRLAQLEVLVNRHRDQLLAKESARGLAKLFA